MPHSNEMSKKSGHKTSNSQSAGMSSGTSNIPVIATSIPQGAPQADTFPETEDYVRQTSENVLNAPSSGQDVEPLGSIEEQEEEDSRSEYSLALGDFGELTELGSPYRASDLPLDRELYSEVTIEFPSCKSFSSYGDSEKGLKKSEKVFSTTGHHLQALRLGETSLRRSISNTTEKNMSRNEHKRVFSEELAILNELLTKLYCFKDGEHVGFALQRIILVNLNQRLRARREQAEEDLIMSGDGIPNIPRWGLTGKADEFWSANDFDILGACYRREVENFLIFLSNHHEFPSTKRETGSKLRAVSPVISGGESLDDRSSVVSTTPRVMTPIFGPGEPDSISRFQRPSTLSYTFHTPGNLNSSVFGHPTQNSSSKALQELLGINNPKKNSTGCVVVSSPSQAAPISLTSRNPPGGVPGPGDSDGDDSGDEEGNRSSRNPRVPRTPRWNPFENSSGEVTASKPTTEPQFDMKLKVNTIPTWDGNPDSLRRWFLKLNSLSKRSGASGAPRPGIIVKARKLGNGLKSIGRHYEPLLVSTT